VRAFEHVLGNFFWAAFAVSNLSTLLAALLMLKLGGCRAALLFLASPGAHFLAYPYSEALFALGSPPPSSPCSRRGSASPRLPAPPHRQRGRREWRWQSR